MRKCPASRRSGAAALRPRAPLRRVRRRRQAAAVPGRRLCFGTLAAALLCTALQIGCTREPTRELPPAGAPVGLLSGVLAAPAALSPPLPRHADFGTERPSRQARRLADWAVASNDHGALPFVVIDKREARLYVFDAGGRLSGAAPVLLGLAPGDDSVPGIGERPLAEVRPEERTTPAGRFVAEPGLNLDGEDIIWVDYEAAVSMHRVRATKPAERRLERLATATATDNRISYGCINLPAAFYDEVLSPAFSATMGIVYVLPETRPLRAQFEHYDPVPEHQSAEPPAVAGMRTRPLAGASASY